MGYLRHQTINPTPPKRVKVWGNGPLKLKNVGQNRLPPEPGHTRPDPSLTNTADWSVSQASRIMQPVWTELQPKFLTLCCLKTPTWLKWPHLFTNTMLVFHWTWITTTHFLWLGYRTHIFLIVTLLILSMTGCIGQLHSLSSLVVNAIYYNCSLICVVFKLHKKWSYAQHINTPTTTILPTTVGIYHGLNCFGVYTYLSDLYSTDRM